MWTVIALFVGVIIGVFIGGLMAAARCNDCRIADAEAMAERGIEQ